MTCACQTWSRNSPARFAAIGVPISGRSSNAHAWDWLIDKPDRPQTLALAIAWKVCRQRNGPGGWAAPGPFPLSERPSKRKSLWREKLATTEAKRATTWDTLSARCPNRPMSGRSSSQRGWERAVARRVGCWRRLSRLAHWNDGPSTSHPAPAGAISFPNKMPGN